jgi:CHASE1-domain containing sensor protein
MPGRRTLLSGLVVLALLVATAVASYTAYESERDDAMDADLELSERVAAEARANVVSVASGLRGASGIVDKDGSLDPVRFRAFARDVIDRSPALGLSWAPRIESDERAAFEEALDRTITGFGPDGEVASQEATGDVYLPVATTYPNTPARRELLGLDTLSDPTRAAAARKAIDAAEPQISPPLTIAQTRQTGAAVYAPVILNVKGAPQTVGVMISGIPGDSIADQVRRQLDLDSRVSISDEGTMITGRPHGESDAATRIEVLGRRWLVSVPATTSTSLLPAISYGVACSRSPGGASVICSGVRPMPSCKPQGKAF